MVGLGFLYLVVCFLYRTNPNPRKLFAVGKSGPNATFTPNFSWVGLALGWGVRRFHNNIDIFPNPTEFDIFRKTPSYPLHEKWSTIALVSRTFGTGYVRRIIHTYAAVGYSSSSVLVLVHVLVGTQDSRMRPWSVPLERRASPRSWTWGATDVLTLVVFCKAGLRVLARCFESGPTKLTHEYCCSRLSSEAHVYRYQGPFASESVFPSQIYRFGTFASRHGERRSVTTCEF